MFFKLSALYFAYFSLLGVLVPYLGLYLESRNFSLLEIAELASMLMLTKIIAPLVWGSIADKYQCSLLLVRIGSVLTLASFSGFFFAETFWQFVMVIFMFSFFWNAILPQIEVITLNALAGRQDRYSQIRLWGSIGFVASVMGAGFLFERIGVSNFPYVALSIIVTIFLLSLLKFSEPPHPGYDLDSASFLAQLLKSDIVLFFLICFLLQLSHGAYYTYFSIYLESLDYSKSTIGLLWSVGVLAEVTLFVVMHKWFSRHSVKEIMFVSLLLTSIRWFLTSKYANDIQALVLLQLLHAFSFGAMHAAAIKFVHQKFDQKNQGRAQALYSSFGFGLGGAVGALTSGMIVSHSDYECVFEFSAVVAMLGLVICTFMPSKSVNSTSPHTRR